MRLAATIDAAAPVRRFKPYPAYKDSGIEWLGKVPAHWNVSRVGELMALVNGFPFESEYFVRGEGVPLVRIRDLNAAETEVNYIGPIVEDAWIGPGDVIIGMDGDFNVARWRGQRALLNQRMCCLRMRNGTDAGFIAYVLPYPLMVINDLTYSTTVKHLSSGDVRKIRLGSPPEAEQRAIAAFLHRETARIDALVAKKEKLIELLQEQRTALISRAVTKGLDPNAPMKDSGIEWLGEIPAHWEVSPVKRIGDLQGGAGFPEDEQGILTEDIPFFKVGDMAAAGNEREMVQTQHTVSHFIARRLRAFVFPIGTIVFAKVGAALRLNRRRLLNRPSCIDNNMMGFIPRNCDTGWAMYWLSGLDLGELANPGAVPSVNEAQIRDLPAVVPPHSEQRRLVAFLDFESAQIDALILKVQNAIGRLKELRTALISAAVTGKIDVRGEVA